VSTLVFVTPGASILYTFIEIAYRRGVCGSSHSQPPDALGAPASRGINMAHVPACNAVDRRPGCRLPPLRRRSPPGHDAIADSIAVGSSVGTVTSSVLPSNRHFQLC